MKNTGFPIYFLFVLCLVTTGCPRLPSLDTDNDGVVDSVDECPDQAGYASTKGCPDADKDGVSDREDNCPDIAGTIALNGCPEPTPDSDGDGVNDDVDECPVEPGTLTLNGCPDSDGDGIADKADECPMQPGLAKNKGCPVTTIEPSTTTITGIIRDENGTPIPFAEIFIEGKQQFTTTDAAGKFTIKDLAVGKYTLKILAKDYDAGFHEISIDENNNSTIELNFNLVKKELIDGSDGATNAKEEAALYEKTVNARGRQRKEFAKAYFSKYKEGKYTSRIKALLKEQPDFVEVPDTTAVINKSEYDCVEEKISQGVIAFDTLPSTMIKGKPYTLEVVINEISKLIEVVKEKEEELGMEIDVNTLDIENGDTIGNIVFEEIKVGALMKVELSEKKGANDLAFFKIDNLYPGSSPEQLIDCQLNARWGWSIEPVRKGENRKLLLNIYIVEEGRDRPIERVREKAITIDIDQNWYQSSFAKTGGLLALATFLVFGIFWYRKKQKDEKLNNENTSKKNSFVLPLSGDIKKKKVFLSYAHEDEDMKVQLDQHLSSLKETQMIETWNDREIFGGETWNEVIKKEIKEANIILFLISANFIASEHINTIEIPAAIKKHKNGKARVIPVYLRPCDIEGLPFDNIKGFPKNAQPVTTFENMDVAFTEIAKGIREIVENELATI